MQLVGVLERVAALVAQDAQALVVGAALHLEHRAALEAHEARVHQVEGDREARHAPRREPLVREPDVGMEVDAARFELEPELLHAVLDPGALDAHAEVAEAHVEEALLAEARPDGGPAPDRGDLAAPGARGLAGGAALPGPGGRAPVGSLARRAPPLPRHRPRPLRPRPGAERRGSRGGFQGPRYPPGRWPTATSNACSQPWRRRAPATWWSGGSPSSSTAIPASPRISIS